MMMERLNMIRADVELRELHRWMGTRRMEDQDHAMHCLLRESFSGLAPRPFRLVSTRGAGTASLYGYTGATVDELQEAAGICADPLQAAILPGSRLKGKPMPMEWRCGRRLGFEVRVRPVIRLPRGPEDPRRTAEVDSYLRDRVLNGRETGGSRETVYGEWLERKMRTQGGAELEPESVRMVNFRRNRAVRKLHSRASEGPDAVMRGYLTIADEERFRALMAGGIGRHKAYGYGMMLLKTC